MIAAIQKIAGVSKNIFYNIEKPEGYARRAADTKRLKQITDFVPSVSLEEGLVEMIEWYRSRV